MKKSTAPHKSLRESSKQETREALISAAMSLFSEEGLDVSLDAICAHAGFTRGAFYVHFKNRDDLISVVMGRVGEQVLDTLLGTVEEDGNVLALVQRFFQALESGEYPLSYRGSLRPHQLLDACARSPEIRTQYTRLVQDSIKRLARHLDKAQQLGLLRQGLPPEHLASMLVALVIGVHTLFDMDYPGDFHAHSLTVLKLLMP